MLSKSSLVSNRANYRFNLSCRDCVYSTSKYETKKKSNKPKEPIILAQNIAGYVGYKDIEELNDYILSDNGGQKKGSAAKSAKSAVMNGSASMGSLSNGVRPRKEKASSSLSLSSSSDAGPVVTTNAAATTSAAIVTKKRAAPEALKGRQSADSIPFARNDSASSEPKTASQELGGRTVQRLDLEQLSSSPRSHKVRERAMSPMSPTQASSVSSFADGYSRSDDEKGYHSDQESGFQMQKTRRHKLRARQQQFVRLPIQRPPPRAAQQAPTPPASTSSAACVAPVSSNSSGPHPLPVTSFVTSYASVATVPVAAQAEATLSTMSAQADVQISAMEFPSLTASVVQARVATPSPRSSSASSTSTSCNNVGLQNSYSAAVLPTSQPPVVMFDTTDAGEDSAIGSFTFGFFDEEAPTVDQQTNNSVPVAAVSAEQVPEPPSTRLTATDTAMINSKLSCKPYYADVDVATFNYNEIINYLRKGELFAVAVPRSLLITFLFSLRSMGGSDCD